MLDVALGGSIVHFGADDGLPDLLVTGNTFTEALLYVNGLYGD